MSRFRRMLFPVSAAVAAMILALLTSILSNFITRGISTSLNQYFLAILAALAGAIFAALVSITIYYNQVSKVEKLQIELVESDEQQQKEKLLRLSEQGLELEKQRTDLEKQGQFLMWQLAAAERVQDDPLLAIIIAYQGLESEIQNLITRVYRVDTNEDTRQEFSVSYNYDMLTSYINPDEAETIMQMRDLRNRIIHGEVIPEEITEDKVRDYVQNAGRIARDISQIEQIHEPS